MGHHAGHLAFRSRRLNHPTIDVHRPARQGKRVDVAGVHHFEIVTELRVLKLLRNRGHESLPDALNERVHLGVTQQRKLLLGLGRRLPS